MKKMIAILLTLTMLFALVACGGGESGGSSSAGTSSAGSETSGGGSSDAGSKTSDAGAQTSDAGSKTSDAGSQEQEVPTVELSGEPIRIGHIADLTGAEALTGKENSNAMKFAVQYIEANGGFAGHPIELIELDAQSAAASAVDAARALVEQYDVACIVGPTLIGHKGAVAGYAAEAQVPVVFYNPTPAGMINDWVIGASGATPQMPTVMADYVYNVLGYDKVYTLTKDDTGGYSYMNPFTDNFTALGGTVVHQEWVPSPTPDFMPYLQNFTDPEVDCLIAWTSGSDALNLWQAWYNMGLSDTLPIVAMFHGGFTDSYICDVLSGTNPDLVDAILGTDAPMTWAYNIDTPENQTFVEAWMEYFKDDEEYAGYPLGSNIPGATVQVLMLLQAAIETLDGDVSDRVALRDALLAADITGPEGRTVFVGSNAATKDTYVVRVAEVGEGQYNYELVKRYADVPPEGLTVD